MYNNTIGFGRLAVRIFIGSNKKTACPEGRQMKLPWYHPDSPCSRRDRTSLKLYRADPLPTTETEPFPGTARGRKGFLFPLRRFHRCGALLESDEQSPARSKRFYDRDRFAAARTLPHIREQGLKTQLFYHCYGASVKPKMQRPLLRGRVYLGAEEPEPFERLRVRVPVIVVPARADAHIPR